MASRIAVLTSAVLVCGITLVVAYPRSGSAVYGAVSAADRPSKVADAIRFRQAHGFRSDDVYVEMAASNPIFSADEYGIPLDTDEINELDRRIRLQRVVEPAREQALDSSDSAGMYFDQGGGGVPVFAFTGNLDKHRSELGSLLPPHTDFRVVAAGRSLRELQALRQQIDAAWGDLQESGVPILSSAFDDSTNSVVIGVATDSDTIDREVQRRFGDSVTVRAHGHPTLDACVDRTHCGNPMKAGLRITWEGHDAYWCSAGFVAKFLGDPTDLRLLSAGHCFTIDGGVGADWSHAGEPDANLGPSTSSYWFENTSEDVGALLLNESGAHNRIFLQNNATIGSIVGYQLSYGYVGEDVCRSAAKTHWMCGNITATDSRQLVEGLHVNHTDVVDFDASPGDSGAPYVLAGINTDVALGMHDDSTDDADPPPHFAWFTPVFRIMADTPYSLCFTSGCQ